MEPNDSIQPPVSAGVEKVNAHEDVKCLWERWDKTRTEDGPSDLVKGSNLVGVGLIIAGSLFQCLGSGVLQYRVAPVFIIIGAALIVVKKLRTLWLQRSVDS